MWISYEPWKKESEKTQIEIVFWSNLKTFSYASILQIAAAVAVAELVSPTLVLSGHFVTRQMAGAAALEIIIKVQNDWPTFRLVDSDSAHCVCKLYRQQGVCLLAASSLAHSLGPFPGHFLCLKFSVKVEETLKNKF